MHRSQTHGSDESAPRGWLALVAALTGIVLVLTARSQLFDTNFYTLWEATALLAGDHPYRDFSEWGVPLQALVSVAGQWAVGYRLIGEFLIQWSFIIAGAVISFQLAVRLSRSLSASAATALLALAILAATPTFHYPKLFFYPLAVWLGWRYVERPGTRRGAALGLATAVAFLFRHDHGVYVGGTAVLAFVLARLAAPASRSVRTIAADSAAYAGTAAVLIVPWMAVVHLSEGLPQYVRARSELYRLWSPQTSPYRSVWTMNPARFLRGEAPPAPRRGVVSFEWEPGMTEDRRQALERRYGLRIHKNTDSSGRWHYEVSNVFDPALLQLTSYISRAEGFEWERLEALASPLPTRAAALIWLQQISLVVPILLLASAGLDVRRSRRRSVPVPLDTYRIVLAAVFLAVIESRLFREPSYVAVVAPLMAALSARFLRWNGTPSVWAWTRWTVAVVMVFVTSIATFVFTRSTGIYEPAELFVSVRPTFSRLVASPPINGYMPLERTRRYGPEAWNRGEVDKVLTITRYLHDCTRAGDRVFVTGSTPYGVGYYVERPIAGGHVFWHHGWRSDAAGEEQSLALLKSQSVPFAFSTNDPVLDDLKTYPRIREYFMTHYTELEGSGGLLLMDTRRQPTGRFGTLGFPCFR